MGDFVHLHNHSHYSLQDAACTVASLIKAAKKYDQHALALTDHGVMYGISEFSKKASKEGIKPLLGMEAYIVMEGSRKEKEIKIDKVTGQRKKAYNHLVLLAKSRKGYQNLIKLSTIGHTEGFYYKPRIDLDVLREYSEGLVCTSACPAGPVSVPLVNGDYNKAKETALLLQELFGDDFYLEVQDHGLEVEKPILEGMPKLSEELGIKLVATNDIHYIEQEHAVAHNILLLLGDKTGKADYHNLRYGTDQVYFKSTEQMKELFGNYKGAIENTLEIADKIDFSLAFEKFHYPNFPIPDDSKAKDLDEYFEELAREGLRDRFGDNITPEIEERFNYELGIIKSMGYSGYFLITQDFINAAKKDGIPVGPGRGSAAGCLVAYCLRITNVDPLEYDLLFERFLNPARKSMPDIDVDFADDQRGDVIEYTKNRYGADSVCQIITFNRLSSKAVLRDVARVLQIPIPTVNSITKWIPSKFGRVFSIEQALNEVPELKWVKESEDDSIKELIRYGKILEGMNRNASKHAAGVVITPGAVSDFVPISRASEEDLVTQFNMKELDDAGLLKMDFLGLRTLTIIRDTLTLIKNNGKEVPDMDEIPLDDPKTYELFSKGQTTAVFQFESAPMREYLKRLRPESIKDLSAMNALYRPGPMEFIDDFIARKHGQKKIEYLHPLLKPILKETYGIIVYQEQVIQIANKVGGMSLAEADILRRAMGKKLLDIMEEQKKKFIDGAAKNNVPTAVAEEIYATIDKFANYGFNKSHAVAYSIVAYQTAYLKAHFLAEFMAANLTNEFGDTDKVALLLDDCRKLKVKVRPPDVNNPSVFFDVDGEEIIFGMSAIKNVGVSAVEEIARIHKNSGEPYKSIYDFCTKVDTRQVNKRALEGLVLAGAFDSVDKRRAASFKVIEDALSFGQKASNAAESAMDSLFGQEEMQIIEPDLPETDEWSQKETLAKEREVLGFYLSDHPLSKLEMEYKSFADIYLGDSDTFKFDRTIDVCGVVTSVRTKIDKSGKTMAFFRLDDFSGSCECLMFSKIFSKVGEYIEEENTILARGTLESSGDAVKLNVDTVFPLSESSLNLTKRIGIYLTEGKHDEKSVEKLSEIFKKYSGNVPVDIIVNGGGKPRKFYLSQKVKNSPDFIREIRENIGEDSVLFSKTGGY